jgi:hypothetical protein
MSGVSVKRCKSTQQQIRRRPAFKRSLVLTHIFGQVGPPCDRHLETGVGSEFVYNLTNGAILVSRFDYTVYAGAECMISREWTVASLPFSEDVYLLSAMSA